MSFKVLLRASFEGNLDVVRERLSTLKLDLTKAKTDAYGRTPLNAAARVGHTEIIRLLIPRSDLRQGDSSGMTALMWAASQGRTEAVRLLLPGSDLTQIDDAGKSALMWAAEAGHLDAVKLLTPGSDLKQVDRRTGSTALALAIDKRQWGCVDLLACADPDFERPQWPASAGPKDLPQWFARLEHQHLVQELAQRVEVAHRPPQLTLTIDPVPPSVAISSRSARASRL